MLVLTMVMLMLMLVVVGDVGPAPCHGGPTRRGKFAIVVETRQIPAAAAASAARESIAGKES